MITFTSLILTAPSLLPIAAGILYLLRRQRISGSVKLLFLSAFFAALLSTLVRLVTRQLVAHNEPALGLLSWGGVTSILLELIAWCFVLAAVITLNSVSSRSAESGG